ncbi:MAG: segregation and condensation protein B [Parcubacteria group bacterium LiPW_15]|nr:MAG: segregation and condensation protein B [Parcubacteria group bacterium LiPW_15]
MENPEKNLAALEALLFVHGEPMSVKKIAEVLKLKDEEAEMLAAEFEKRLLEESRGLSLVTLGDRVQLTTKPELNSALEDFVKAELSEELTPASLEVLSLVSYLGPISRSKLEYIRGVNSSFILRSLLIRGLVERSIGSEHSLAYLYQPTFALLEHLGIKSVKDLPDYEKFRSLLTPVAEAAVTEEMPSENPQ